MEIKTPKILIIKNLFFFLNIVFYFSPPKNKELMVSKIRQKTKVKKKHDLNYEDLKERNYKKQKKLIKLNEEFEKKIMEDRTNKLVFSWNKFSLSRKEIFKILLFQTFLLFYAVFFLSWLLFFLFFKNKISEGNLFIVVLFFVLLFSVFIFFFEVVYFFSRCNLIMHSDSPWTALYFISFFIFNIINYYINSSLFKGFSDSDHLIEKFVVFKPLAGYTNISQMQIDRENHLSNARYILPWNSDFLFLEKTIIITINGFSYNTEGILLSIIFFIGLVAETYFFFKEVKINRLLIILSDGCFFFTISYSVFGYRGIEMTNDFDRL